MRVRLVRPLTPAELDEVTDLWKHGRTHLERIRAQAVLLSHRGLCVTSLCQVLGIARSTGQRILHHFTVGGPASLRNPPRPGRPSRCGPAAEAFIRRLLERSPRALGHDTNTWTCALLAQELEREHHILLTPDAMRKLLHRLEMRQVRPNHYLARASEVEKRGLSRS